MMILVQPPLSGNSISFFFFFFLFKLVPPNYFANLLPPFLPFFFFFFLFHLSFFFLPFFLTSPCPRHIIHTQHTHDDDTPFPPIEEAWRSLGGGVGGAAPPPTSEVMAKDCCRWSGDDLCELGGVVFDDDAVEDEPFCNAPDDPDEDDGEGLSPKINFSMATICLP